MCVQRPIVPNRKLSIRFGDTNRLESIFPSLSLSLSGSVCCCIGVDCELDLALAGVCRRNGVVAESYKRFCGFVEQRTCCSCMPPISPASCNDIVEASVRPLTNGTYVWTQARAVKVEFYGSSFLVTSSWHPHRTTRMSLTWKSGVSDVLWGCYEDATRKLFPLNLGFVLRLRSLFSVGPLCRRMSAAVKNDVTVSNGGVGE